MKIADVTALLEQIAPVHLQESYDNAGLIVGYPDASVSGILFSLDCVESVVDEAIQKGCNLIIAHHPIVFRGMKRFNGASYVERTVMKAIQHQVALYAIHTNLDNVLHKGVNERMARQIGLTDLRILAPKPGLEGVGAGVIGHLPDPMSELDFLHHLKKSMQTSCVRHTRLLGKQVRQIAVCGGAGSGFLPAAIRAGADVYVSADFKYHEFFDAEAHLVIADIGHFESEQFTIPLLYEIICEKYPNFALHLTEQNTNPVNYL